MPAPLYQCSLGKNARVPGLEVLKGREAGLRWQTSCIAGAFSTAPCEGGRRYEINPG